LASSLGKLRLDIKSRVKLLDRLASLHVPIPYTMWSFTSLLSLAALICHTQALYFYIDGPSQKCFFEELPKDTLVVGMVSS